MIKDIESIASRLKMDKEDLLILQEKVVGKVKDMNGGNSSMLSLTFRSIGIAEYVLTHDVNRFRVNLAEAVKLSLGLFRRFEAGEPIDGSLVSMLSYKDLFNALAAEEFSIAQELASVIGGRDKLEKYYDHPFDYAFGYTLKWFVLKDRPNMELWMARFREVCQKKAPGGFAGYVELFEAILSESSAQAAEAVRIMIKGHEKMSKGRGIFALTDDKHLCVWGIGMVNLARSFYGLDVPAAPPLIPADLLV